MKNDKGVGQKMTRNGRKMNLTIVTTRLGVSVFTINNVEMVKNALLITKKLLNCIM